ncbi:hypothetical protein [Aliivibrio fischeri]|uniref:hypothetical protein n=1 Tax=Aliivibrio fischeri TaxID=668 RepID=UPI0007C53690|nr:hypothetical protein [Aliivibrio fischeri]
MPTLLSDKHEDQLLSRHHYIAKGYCVRAKKTIAPVGLGTDVEYHLLESVGDGCLVVHDESDTTIANFKFTKSSQNFFDASCIAINSSYVKPGYQGLGIAPPAYKMLIDEYNVLSDFEQTFHGAHLWRTKISQFKDVNVYIIEDMDQLMRDMDGKPVLYKYDPSGENPLDNRIWGLDDSTVLKNVSPISASSTETLEDVRLLAVKNNKS